MAFFFSSPRRIGWLIVLLAAVMTLPFLAATEFYSKGEPREALIAISMIDSGNWILPENSVGEIGYKPPLLHWCIATLYTLAGQVNEYLSRLPSALAFIIFIFLTFRFFTNHSDVRRGILTALLTLTAFEVHRAGNSCRVDMLLTLFIVWALYLLYRWQEREYKGFPWLAVLCMSLGTLTKGPVAIILPILVIGCWTLWHRCRSVSVYLKLFACPFAAMILPSLWYWAAYRQGGDAFLTLMLEENVGRFLGKMTYESHEHSFVYNFLTLLSGWAPWTLLFPVLLFVRRYKEKQSATAIPSSSLKSTHKSIPYRSTRHFAWLSFGLILLFYCIPSSKRSTYLLPCYPFMAYLMADFWARHMRGTWRQRGRRWMVYVISGVIIAFMLMDSVIVPLAVKKKYDSPLATYITHTFPDETIYSFIDNKYLQFYCTNFYLRDRLRQFNSTNPDKGILMLARKDLPAFRQRYGEAYVLQPISHSTRAMTERRDVIEFYKFKLRSKM